MDPFTDDGDARADEAVGRLRAAGCVFAEAEARLLGAEARDLTHLQEMVDRRVRGEPLEHVVGWAEFMGARVHVGPGVFVPRRRSEFLVETALAQLHGLNASEPLVVDVCCGSGAIGAAIAARTRVRLVALDIDPVATACARANLGDRALIVTGDLLESLDPGLRNAVDLIVASPPYVPTREIDYMPAEARLHEPRRALDGGRDGLELVHRMAVEAVEWLSPTGVALVEIAREQAHEAMRTARGEPSILTCDVRDGTVLRIKNPPHSNVQGVDAGDRT